MVVFKQFSRKHFSDMPDWNVLYTSECFLCILHLRATAVHDLHAETSKTICGEEIQPCRSGRGSRGNSLWACLWHILRYRAHFSPACQKSVFMKIAWKQTIKAYINSKCIYFAYQLTLFAFWRHLDTFQAKLAWLDQRKFPIFSRLAALCFSS